MKISIGRQCKFLGCLGLLFVCLASFVNVASAQNVRIRYRPLTPQEIKDYGLTNTTQKSGGAPNAGLGQPVYLEALVSNAWFSAVTSVTWTLAAVPAGSAMTVGDALLPGPLSNAIPTYDGGDRIGLFVAGRAVLKPDVQSYWIPSITNLADFKVRTVINTTNTTVTLTNSVYGAVYIGQKSTLCTLCHANKQAAFDQTDHATAFTRMITGVASNHFSANCISCHTVGYDTTPGAVNDGFDDIATQVGWIFPGTSSPTNWSGMNTNLQSRANVQCENCHGPASAHMLSLGRTNAIDISLSAGTCGQCHDSLPHHVKPYEWGQSLHSTGYVFRFSGSCLPCHSTKGFIETWDPYYLSTNIVPRATESEGVTCAACHDPHTVGMGEHQLRAITTATLSNGVVITAAEAGMGVLCMNCHHARQNAATTVAGSGSISPHHGTQGDMLAGENAYEYGLDMPSSRHLEAVTNSCVGCHMQLIATSVAFSNANTHVGGHTFKIEWDGGTTNEADDVKVTEVCKTCHVGLYNTFDFGGEDYDQDGTIEGVQSEIQGLLNQIALLLPPVGSTTITYSAGFTPAQRAAYFNYQYVWEDKSLGVHNPKYASSILQASVADLNGGIDFDRDGLIDTWEMAKFGNLTSQNGNGDADGDGLSNKMEMQVGTNPNLADSDGDGLSDRAELQAGTNPLDNLSVAPTNSVSVILPAYELGYMPGQAGVTQVFQYVDAMGDNGGWSNAGPSFVSSNGMAYQLISLRDSTQKYYRVVKP